MRTRTNRTLIAIVEFTWPQSTWKLCYYIYLWTKPTQQAQIQTIYNTTKITISTTMNLRLEKFTNTTNQPTNHPRKAKLLAPGHRYFMRHFLMEIYIYTYSCMYVHQTHHTHHKINCSLTKVKLFEYTCL